MIQITFYTEGRNIRQLLMTGHAGYAEEGFDIVCAAVSSQVISVENSLHQLLNIDVMTEANEAEGGYLKMTIPTDLSKTSEHDAQLLLRHLHFAFEVLAESYPEYIQINHQEYKS